MIESYTFGSMVVDGQKYTADLIIFPGRIKSSWWRKTGHTLSMKDIEDVFKEEPEVLVVGTGAMGVMKVEDEVKRYSKEHGIKLIIEKTAKAVESFNTLSEEKRTIGAFHLTC